MSHPRILLASQRQTKRLLLLNEITQSALTGSSLKEIMDLLARRVVEILAATGCFITRWDNERQVSIPFSAYGDGSAVFLNGESGSDGELFSQTVIQSKHAVFIENIIKSNLLRNHLAAHFPYNSVLVLPLKTIDQNLGCILIKYHRPHQCFFKGDLNHWEETASQISLAIASILSIEKEKQRRKEAELLQQATFAITSSLNLQEVLDNILTGLEQAVPFDSAAITLIEGDYLRIAALGGYSRHTRQVDEKIGKLDGLFSLLEFSNSPVILGDAQIHPKYVKWSKEGNDPIHGWMGVPLISYNSAIGFLMLNSHKRDIFTANHARLAQAFANQAAVAIENARLFEQVRNGRERLQALSEKLVETQENERRLIAHELHDEVGQELTGLQFILLMGKEGPDSEHIHAFSEAQGLVSSLMSQVRELSLNLHPGSLEDLGLLPALKAHFDRFQQQTGIRVHFDHLNLDRRFAAEIELSAFRVVQETLTNVARYAEVKDVDVVISADNALLNIQVEDHGQGFELDLLRDSRRSFGVTGIRERTYLAGGKFEISSKPGQGTRVVAAFPTNDKLERRGNDRQSINGR
jgi:signal transduction histidine kinase